MANIVITIPQAGGEKKYVLEFNRRVIIKMEEEGIIKKMEKSAKQETIDSLVYYACVKNQPDITKKEVEEIVDNIPLEKLGDFVQAIGELLNKSIDALEKQGNAHWEAH